MCTMYNCNTKKTFFGLFYTHTKFPAQAKSGVNNHSDSNFYLALPDDNNTDPVNQRTEFRFRNNDTAIIDCPIPPGRRLSNYFVRWQCGETLFYATSFLTTPPVSRASSRYNIDPGNFSLTISQVTPGDARFCYRCVLGVEEDTKNPTGRNMYAEVGVRNMTIVVASKYAL